MAEDDDARASSSDSEKGLGLRSSEPGRKRLIITLTTFVSFLVGIPFWYSSTQVYRAPLPFNQIDSYARLASSSSLQLRCHLHVILASGSDNSFTEAKLDAVATRIQQQIYSLVSRHSVDYESCQTGFDLLVTLDTPNLCMRSGNHEGISIWPCGLGNIGFLENLHLSDDDAIDDLLWSFSNEDFSSVNGETNDKTTKSEGGLYTVVLLQKDDEGTSESCGPLDGENTNMCTAKESEQLVKTDAEGGVSPWKTVVGKYRHAWISGGSSFAVESMLASRIAEVAVNFFGGSKIGSAEDRYTSMPLSADGEAILSFSLLNAEPSDWIFDWSFEQLEGRFLQPVVEALNGIALLKVESQVLYYTPKAVQSQWVPALNAHVVPIEQLPFLVNANEWHLDSSTAAAGRSKILHFALYVPATNEWPLHFQGSDGQLSSTNAFTSPGWGGVAIWNPSNFTPISPGRRPTVTVLTVKDFELFAGVFVAQIRTLFGLPPTVMEDTKSRIFGCPATGTGFADWELDLLLRRRVIEDVTAAASTLTSLARLVRKLPNMLIMEEIGDQVKISLAAAADAHSLAQEGNYLATAEAARTARSLAEAAFFQPSIMSLLYNPTEHHLAIYTPFFVPVLLHAVLAVVKEVSHHRQEWKRFKQKQQ